MIIPTAAEASPVSSTKQESKSLDDEIVTVQEEIKQMKEMLKQAYADRDWQENVDDEKYKLVWKEVIELLRQLTSR